MRPPNGRTHVRHAPAYVGSYNLGSFLLILATPEQF